MPVLHDRPRTACPQCGALIEFYLKCHGVQVLDRASGDVVPALPLGRARTPGESAVLVVVEREGLLSPFQETLEFVKHGVGLPRDLAGYFVSYLRQLLQRPLPRWVQQAVMPLAGPGHLDYYSAQGVGLLVRDGYLWLFVPHAQVHPVATPPDALRALRTWLATGWGSIPGREAALDHLRKCALGD